MRGGDFGARARRRRGVFRTPSEEPEREELDRGAVDRSNAGALTRRRLLGTGKIDVTVKSHSEGQKNVSEKGPFKPVTWHRHTQMQEAGHGPANPPEMSGGGIGGDPGAGPG